MRLSYNTMTLLSYWDDVAFKLMQRVWNHTQVITDPYRMDSLWTFSYDNVLGQYYCYVAAHTVKPLVVQRCGP